MNQASEYGSVIDFPQHRSHRNYSSGYLDGMADGERYANTNFVWIGAAIGIVASAVVVLCVLFYAGLV